MAEEKKKNFWRRFLKRYIIVVYNQGNFKERISISLTPINLILVLSSLIAFTMVITWLLVMYTPIRSTIPGITSSTPNDLKILKLQSRVDSCMTVIHQDSTYIESIKKVLGGVDTGKTSMTVPARKSIFQFTSFGHTAEALRPGFTKGEGGAGMKGDKRIYHLFPPVQGYISQHFNPAEDHYATDFVTEKDAPVKAVDDGMVVFSEWSAETGNVIVIQHANNLLSIYKHNSVILKKVGTFVNRGDVIALVGNSGELTTGPHLHFELWAEGSPLDPEIFISF